MVTIVLRMINDEDSELNLLTFENPDGAGEVVYSPRSSERSDDDAWSGNEIVRKSIV